MEREYGFSEYGDPCDMRFPEPITVSALNELIKDIFDNIPHFRDVFIQGEISNFKNHYATGHFYFTLKDENSSVKAVMFRSYASRVAFSPENGMKVTVHGRVAVFPRDGQYQIYCDSMEPVGIGSLYAAFEQLKAKLSKEGLFDPSHKKEIPFMPKTVGVVTSSTGAAVRDIINVLGRRSPLTEVVIYPAIVQGSDAPKSLIEGINYFNRTKRCDVIIIGRGGGSIEDLWGFNSEALARVIYDSTVPIISAVGHETDFTISDFTADLRAPTPSAAAELAVPDLSDLKIHLGDVKNRMASAVNLKCRHLSEKLERYAGSNSLKDPMAYINEKNMLLAEIYADLESSIERTFDKKEDTLKRNAALLDSLSPLAVLSRGYSVAYVEEGKPIVSVSSVSADDILTVRASDGKIITRVTGKESL